MPTTNLPGAPDLQCRYSHMYLATAKALVFPAALPPRRGWDRALLAAPIAPAIASGCAYHAGAGSTRSGSQELSCLRSRLR